MFANIRGGGGLACHFRRLFIWQATSWTSEIPCGTVGLFVLVSGSSFGILGRGARLSAPDGWTLARLAARLVTLHGSDGGMHT